MGRAGWMAAWLWWQQAENVDTACSTLPIVSSCTRPCRPLMWCRQLLCPRALPAVREIPLWVVADAQKNPIASMDPPGNAFEIYSREVSCGRWRRMRAATT